MELYKKKDPNLLNKLHRGKMNDFSKIRKGSNFNAYTRKNLGSIPSKVEKTLIKTEESIPITLTLNKQIQKINLPSDIEQKHLRNFSTSYSSKGYGVGFVSKVPRFDYRRGVVYPGPGDYSPEKNDSMENNVNKSIDFRMITSFFMVMS